MMNSRIQTGQTDPHSPSIPIPSTPHHLPRPFPAPPLPAPCHPACHHYCPLPAPPGLLLLLPYRHLPLSLSPLYLGMHGRRLGREEKEEEKERRKKRKKERKEGRFGVWRRVCCGGGWHPHTCPSVWCVFGVTVAWHGISSCV